VITIVDYDPAWPGVFDGLRHRYEAVLSDVTVVAIEHVGSTSVPGLAAKPVIDVDIIVALEHLADAIAAMELAGFRSLGELGIPDRWAFDAPSELPRTNTYVVVDGSLAMRNHLGVRAVLRSDSALRDEYASLKRSIASRVDDIDTYVEAKSTFLSTVLERAGLTSDERRIIEEATARPDNRDGRTAAWGRGRTRSTVAHMVNGPVSKSSSEAQPHARAQ
jgi:GrpB-like predicted nucleotidyltransferase (UPF0157 family)